MSTKPLWVCDEKAAEQTFEPILWCCRCSMPTISGTGRVPISFAWRKPWISLGSCSRKFHIICRCVSAAKKKDPGALLVFDTKAEAIRRWNTWQRKTLEAFPEQFSPGFIAAQQALSVLPIDAPDPLVQPPCTPSAD